MLLVLIIQDLIIIKQNIRSQTMAIDKYKDSSHHKNVI